MTRSGIKALTLDAGGTLFHPSRPAGEVYAEMAARWGRQVNEETIQARFVEAWARWSLLDPGRATVATPDEERRWWKELVREVFRGPDAPEDFDGFFEELYRAFAAPEAWSLYPEVRGTLDRLRDERVPVAVVSNWDSRLDILCERLGLSGHFVAVIASGRAGVSKPDRRIFALALDRLHVEATEAGHIGDSLRDDVHGARGAGMRAVWLRRGSDGLGGPPVPQAVGREPEAAGAAPAGVPCASSLDEAVGLMLS